MVTMITLTASLSSCNVMYFVIISFYVKLDSIFEKWLSALVASSARSIRLHCEKELKQFLSPPLEGIVFVEYTSLWIIVRVDLLVCDF